MRNIIPVLRSVKNSSYRVRALSDAQRQALLLSLADLISDNVASIIEANQLDLDKMPDTNPKKDRLLLNPERIQNLVTSVRDISQLEDPSGKLLSEKTLKNGLHVQKMSVPLGVVGIIYEARPNVTVDVAALCLRSGNGVVLRGGSAAHNTNIALVKLIHKAMKAHALPSHCLALFPTERAYVDILLTAERYVDIIIPRGSQNLIDRVRQKATVPTIETGAGVCHTYVSKYADLAKAAEIIVNAKTSRPSVCNALDTVLVDKAVADELLPLLIPGFAAHGVQAFADEAAYQILAQAGYADLKAAKKDDFGREFLSYKCSIKCVKDIDQALDHIATYSSRHSEAIVSEDNAECERFLSVVDAAAVYTNASTRFTDGGVFGLGAEIGISTQKLHARGPFALEKLVTEKWIIRGDGQIR
ncbi:MAG: glutamate-5-semialdehyde dehydrogenase [Bacteroidia bacterium]